MTMDVSQNEADFLTNSLFKEKVPVTYMTMSRTLGTHQNYAKTALYQMYIKNKESLCASFIITGEGNKGSRIHLVHGESELSNAQKAFTRVESIHVYSLSNKEAQVNSIDLAQEELKHSIKRENVPDYCKRGMIKGPDFEVVEQHRGDVGKALPSGIGKETISKKREEPKIKSSSNTVKNTGLSSGYVSRKQSGSVQPSKRASTLGSYFPEKENKSVNMKRPATSGYQYKSRKMEKKDQREKVVICNEGGQEEEEEDKSPVVKPKTSDLNSIFDDDFSDDESSKKTEQNEVDPEPMIVDNNVDVPDSVAEDDEAKNLEKGKEDEKTEDITDYNNPEEVLDIRHELSKKNQSASNDVAVATKPEPIEKDPDAEGYITSYRKTPSLPVKDKKMPIKRPATKSSTPSGSLSKKNDSKKAQSSLMNFFQKK